MGTIQIQQKYNLFNARSDFNRILKGIEPKGATLLRDSICFGIKKILSMNEEIRRFPDLDFHFIHIILTDGSDQGSKMSVLDLGVLMRVVGVAISKKAITNHFIGINMSASDQKQFQALAELGEDTSHFHLAKSAETGKIFDRIQASIQIEQKVVGLTAIQAGEHTGLVVHKNNQMKLNIQVKRFIVVFNLDISGSMAGESWNQVREAVSKFTLAFKEGDLFSIILFNSSINELAPTEDQMFGGDQSKSLAQLRAERQQTEQREKQLEDIQIQIKKEKDQLTELKRQQEERQKEQKELERLRLELKKKQQCCNSECSIY